MSAFESKADMVSAPRNVRFWEPDIQTWAPAVLSRQQSGALASPIKIFSSFSFLLIVSSSWFTIEEAIIFLIIPVDFSSSRYFVSDCFSVDHLFGFKSEYSQLAFPVI